eukprot:3832126-Amphidinium_carterae.2
MSGTVSITGGGPHVPFSRVANCDPLVVISLQDTFKAHETGMSKGYPGVRLLRDTFSHPSTVAS